MLPAVVCCAPAFCSAPCASPRRTVPVLLREDLWVAKDVRMLRLLVGDK